MKNSSLGSLIFLAGISLIGFIWFKRNKVTIGEQQLQEISKESASINSIDKPFEYNEGVIQNSIKNPYLSSSISDKDQSIINQGVKESIDCNLGVFSIYTGTDCTRYWAEQEKLNNPLNINTKTCTKPTLFITNVIRNDANYPNVTDRGSLWRISFSVCGVDYKKTPPLSIEAIFVDSVGSQKIELKGPNIVYAASTYQGNFGGNLERRPKNAVITLSIKFDNGTSVNQTYNYKQ
jgi:hypothetical protein